MAQVKDGILFGLTAALYGRCDIKNGGVKKRNFHNYPIMKMAESPILHVKLLQSDDTRGGFGEIGLPIITLAVTNA